MYGRAIFHFQEEARCGNYRFSFNYFSFACSPLLRYYREEIIGELESDGDANVQQYRHFTGKQTESDESKELSLL